MEFGLAVNPEFLREGSSVHDFFDPPKTVIGQFDEASGDADVVDQGLPFSAPRNRGNCRPSPR